MEQKLLVCDCGDCKHWEIGEAFIKCKTCSTVYTLDAKHAKAFDDGIAHLEANHHKLSWQKTTA